MDYLHRQYIQHLQTRLRNFRPVGKGYNFSCPFCGDSAKDKHKARGFLLTKKGKVYYYCHNNQECNCSFDNFLKNIDINLFKQYKLERFKESNKSTIRSSVEPLRQTEPTEVIDTKVGLQSILELTTEHPARKYIESRKIPEKFWTDIYYCPEWWKYVNEKCNLDKEIISDHERIIFPIRNHLGYMVAFQGRSINNTEKQRYITIKITEDAIKLFGQDRVNNNKPVFILEGPIDSFFIDNGVALCGSDIDLNICPYFGNRVFILDREPRNRAIVSKYYKLIDKGEKIVSWLHSPWKEKDINDIILNNNVSIEQVNSWIKDHIVSGLKAKLEMDQWKKI